MIKKKIYTAGAMTGLSFDDYNSWREKLKNLIDDINSDWVVINPAEHFTPITDNKFCTSLYSEREVMEWELWAVKTSDVLVVNLSPSDSLGTMAEITTAYNAGIPVIGYNAKSTIHPWIENMAMHICEDEEDLISYLIYQFLNQD